MTHKCGYDSYCIKSKAMKIMLRLKPQLSIVNHEKYIKMLSTKFLNRIEWMFY